MSRWLGCFPEDSIPIDQGDDCDPGPRCSTGQDSHRSMAAGLQPSLHDGLRCPLDNVKLYHEETCLISKCSFSHLAFFSSVDLNEGAILQFGNVCRRFSLSQLEGCDQHLVGRGQGGCHTSHNAQNSPHCREPSSPKWQYC